MLSSFVRIVAISCGVTLGAGLLVAAVPWVTGGQRVSISEGEFQAIAAAFAAAVDGDGDAVWGGSAANMEHACITKDGAAYSAVAYGRVFSAIDKPPKKAKRLAPEYVDSLKAP